MRYRRLPVWLVALGALALVCAALPVPPSLNGTGEVAPIPATYIATQYRPDVEQRFCVTRWRPLILDGRDSLVLVQFVVRADSLAAQDSSLSEFPPGSCGRYPVIDTHGPDACYVGLVDVFESIVRDRKPWTASYCGSRYSWLLMPGMIEWRHALRRSLPRT